MWMTPLVQKKTLGMTSTLQLFWSRDPTWLRKETTFPTVRCKQIKQIKRRNTLFIAVCEQFAGTFSQLDERTYRSCSKKLIVIPSVNRTRKFRAEKAKAWRWSKRDIAREIRDARWWVVYLPSPLPHKYGGGTITREAFWGSGRGGVVGR